MSKIEWTDATWNPTRRCRRVSPGCENCYAEKMAHRFSGPGLPYEGLIQIGKQGPRWNGEGRFVPDTLDAPLHWRDPSYIFVNSMSDLFFERFSNEEIAAVFGVMAACPQHAFQVLTKRPGRALQWFAWLKREASTVNAGRGMSEAAYCLAMAQKQCSDVKLAQNVDKTCARPWPLPNVWIGVSVEDQQRANERIPQLLRIPAAVRFVSYEPALGPVDWTHILLQKSVDLGPDVTVNALYRWYGGALEGQRTHIEWLIVGGESGPDARPFDLAWARSAVQQCQDAGVAVFVKQLGAVPVNGPGNRCPLTAAAMTRSGRIDAAVTDDGQGLDVVPRIRLRDSKGGYWSEWPQDLRIREFPQ